MKLKGCRLTEKQQDRLVEFFVGEMTARTAADLVGINKTTGAYFFHRLRAIIAWQLDEASPLAGEVEAEFTSVANERGSVAVAPPARFPSSASSSAAARSTPR